MDRHFSQRSQRKRKGAKVHSPASCAPPRRESNLSEVPAGWCEESAKRRGGRDHSHRMRIITRGKVRKTEREEEDGMRVGERSV